MGRVGADGGEGGGGIHVHERPDGARPGVLEDAGQQLVVEHTDAAGFDDDVCVLSLGQHRLHAGDGCGIHGDLRPVGRLDIAVALPVEGVRLVERDAVAQPGQRAQQATVIRCGTVPI